ncbi:hypothetical protein RRG08_040379 [Elysia crispata]|uniref:Uncharacterized protein n=1 Tax=Elysia crispata TaxID=231223 RepID=A0AAE1DQU6_9GAST|nr:hypothetical protein RRG08_040379 [Elysia crispata]
MGKRGYLLQTSRVRHPLFRLTTSSLQPRVFGCRALTLNDSSSEQWDPQTGILASMKTIGCSDQNVLRALWVISSVKRLEKLMGLVIRTVVKLTMFPARFSFLTWLSPMKGSKTWSNGPRLLAEFRENFTRNQKLPPVELHCGEE